MTLPAEIALALDCTRIHPDQITVRRLRARIDDDFSWPRFLQFAIPHGILPLAAYNLGLYASDLAPRATLVQLDHLRNRVRKRYEEQSCALVDVMGAFAEENLRVLAYKGPALIARAYPDPGLREFHDLDLWTDPGDTAKAGDMLRQLGYRPSRYEDGVPQPARDAGKEHTEFLSREGTVVIDLQNLELHPQFNYRPEFAELWERRSAISISGKAIASLGAEDLLSALAAHGSKHLWRRLNWVVDVAAMLASSPALDWDAVIEHSLRWRCHRRLLSSFAMQVILYDAVFPAEITARIRRYGSTMESAASAIDRALRPPKAGTFHNASSVFYHHYRCTDRLLDRLALGGRELERRANRGVKSARDFCASFSI